MGDLALFDAVITGNLNAIRPAPLRGVKLGVARGYFFADLDAEVECITNAALRKLQDVGVELVEAEVADLADLIQKTTLPIANHDLVRTLPKSGELGCQPDVGSTGCACQPGNEGSLPTTCDGRTLLCHGRDLSGRLRPTPAEATGEFSRLLRTDRRGGDCVPDHHDYGRGDWPKPGDYSGQKGFIRGRNVAKYRAWQHGRKGRRA